MGYILYGIEVGIYCNTCILLVKPFIAQKQFTVSCFMSIILILRQLTFSGGGGISVICLLGLIK